MSQVHAQARTTPRTRAEIKASSATLVELAERYNISKATVRKWKGRESTQDLSHRAHHLCTTLTPAQEAIAVELRSTLLLPLDDLLAVVREFINPNVSRSGLDRCLRRHGVGNLRALQAKALADAGGSTSPVKTKTFKDYEPGFVHMDIKYLPQMPDESHRRYLFVAIDRATRWVFMHIYGDQSEDSSVDFLNRLEQTAPMKIIKLLTDNGSQFTDRFTRKKREPTGHHKFDVRCKALNIEHRLCPPRHPQTNGMVERFNGRISEVVSQTRFACAADLESTLMSYMKTYNHLIPQRALKHLSPVQALKKWYDEKPELFKKKVYNQTGLDISQVDDDRDSICIRYLSKPAMPRTQLEV
jgi:transposase InsO family protein